MRRFALGFCIFSIIFLNSGGAFAQKIIDKNQINERIKALRCRLKEYQASFKKVAEKPEEIFEKISEDLENREDVAVTVLYRDPESPAEEYDLNNDANVRGNFHKETDQASLGATEENMRLEELEKRKQLYDSLREKVFQATKRTRNNAQDINNALAQLH
ncbi:MAG: hypothetical protein Kow0029_17190 [Candidatus Rifleibacteriota bacterium]